MKKAEFVALGISEELAAKAEKASLEELKGYVEKSKHDEVVEENRTLKTSVSDRDKQLETLKVSAGDNEELKKQIEDMKKQNADQEKLTTAEEVHHVTPLSRGGTHDRSNLMALCKKCHSEITAREGGRWERRR